jgi:hypothetical protein
MNIGANFLERNLIVPQKEEADVKKILKILKENL